ncbi:MAG: esterase-like activity of phytase family protein [Hyphomicrobium sp.]
MSGRRTAIFFGLAGAVAAAMFAVAETSNADIKPNPRKLEVGAVEITAAPIASFNRFGAAETRFGKLEFRGGLILTAPGSRNFGGWSGLALDADGRTFTSVSDSGVWLTGTLAYKDNVLTGIDNARIGPLLALDGQTLKRNRDRDAEAIAVASGSAHNGALIVSYEQNSRLVRYDVTSAGFSTARSLLEKPKNAAGMRRNNGFEAMTVMKGGPFKGAAVAVSERHYDASRNHTGWIWAARGPEIFHLTNIGDFDITDIASLDDGTLFVLERRFRWLEGIKMRIRRIAAGELRPGATADGEILIEANLEYEIDNMEGMAAHRGPGGDTILTLISDDNFNHFLQRTLLLQFAVQEIETANTRPQR